MFLTQKKIKDDLIKIRYIPNYRYKTSAVYFQTKNNKEFFILSDGTFKNVPFNYDQRSLTWKFAKKLLEEYCSCGEQQYEVTSPIDTCWTCGNCGKIIL